MSSIVESLLGYSDVHTIVQDMLSSFGFELLIFAVTLACTIGVNLFSKYQQRPTKSKHQENRPLRHKTVEAASAELDGPWEAPTSTPACHIAARLINEIVRGCKQPKLQTGLHSLSLYEELKRLLTVQNLKVPDVARHAKYGGAELYGSIIHTALSSGVYDDIEVFLDDMASHGVARTLSFYESVMKQAAGQKLHALALRVYDRMQADGLQASSVTLSCLVGFAADVGELDRAVTFFESLANATTPSIRAYMTVLRVYSKQRNWPASVVTLHRMFNTGVKVDALVLNCVLATGVSCGVPMKEVSDVLLDAEERKMPVSDIVSYNTLLKGYVQNSDAENASNTFQRLRQRGLEPNAITMNTTMDAAIRAGDHSQAWAWLDEMRSLGIRPDKFTCSILLKNLNRVNDSEPSAAKVQRIKNCLALLGEVDLEKEHGLRSYLYHSLMDAAKQIPDSGNLIFEVMAGSRRYCTEAWTQSAKGLSSGYAEAPPRGTGNQRLHQQQVARRHCNY